jgi:hypothetical protein
VKKLGIIERGRRRFTLEFQFQATDHSGNDVVECHVNGTRNESEDAANEDYEYECAYAKEYGG